MTFAHKFCVGNLVGIDIHLDLLSQCLLNGVELNQILLELSLVFDPLWRVLVLFELLELVREVVHLIQLVSLLDVKVGLLAGSPMIWNARERNRWVLFRIIGVLNQHCAIRIFQSALNILPYIVEVHNLVVLEFVFVNAHLLPMNLLEALSPFVRVGQEL